jgi:thiol-disulfide isomerase/thioredoxin
LQEYLINYYLTEYVSYAGTEFLDEFMPLYEKKVIDSKKREKFYALCDTWRKIEPGAPSPTFAYTDINGKKVTLEDFRGKYVYIDVWATWCGPCCGEIPHLKELEHHFAKKNIAFVSISCDRDKSAWEKMVKKEKLGGIQLHNGGDRTFMNDYMVKGIPRFILLDREGKIINSRMTRPSNPETTQFIETLEGL